MNLRTINWVIDKLELQLVAAQCTNRSTELIGKALEVAKYAKGQFKLNKQRKKGKLEVNNSSLVQHNIEFAQETD